MKMVMVKLADIKEQYNPRTTFLGMDELKRSIESVGLLQPIVVRLAATQVEGVYALVDGARRLRALKELGQKETQAHLVDASSADEAQLAANLVRSDLNILERARGYAELVKKFPAKYNAVAIGKAFGHAAKTSQRLIAIGKALPASLDKSLASHISEIGLEGLETIAQVPAKNQEALAKEIDKRKGNMSWAMREAFKSLDYMGDALNTGALVSQGKAFVVGRTAYTTDPTVYAEAKKAYEAKTKAQYGAGEKKQAAKTEKQKAAEKAERAKDREDRAKSSDFVRKNLASFLDSPATPEEMQALGRELVERHLKTDAARTILGMFGIKETNDGGCYPAQRSAWTKVFGPLCKSPASLVRLADFLSISTWDRKSAQQSWEMGMKKKGMK